MDIGTTCDVFGSCLTKNIWFDCTSMHMGQMPVIVSTSHSDSAGLIMTVVSSMLLAGHLTSLTRHDHILACRAISR